jgi:nickel/cobalt exporter
MTPLSDLLQQGAAHAWLFIPSAILLGALHGLEPGHSKTMMAAFIIAVRGTVPQAVLLGLAATVSHTLVVWAVALVGLRYASQINPETTEPYFQVASAVLIVGVAVWMIGRTWREQRPVKLAAHSHDHDAETRRIDTGHGVVALEVFEDGVPPRWRIRTESGHGWPVSAVTVETVRTDGTGRISPLSAGTTSWSPRKKSPNRTNSRHGCILVMAIISTAMTWLSPSTATITATEGMVSM